MNIKLIQKDIDVFINKKYKASITVEAALSFTITIFVLFAMLGPLLINYTASDILIELNNASLDPNGSRVGASEIDKTILDLANDAEEDINGWVNENIELCREDWNDYEIAWEFRKHPLI